MNIWRVFYWTAFVLGWIIFPLMLVYVGSGDFTIKGKIKRACINNLIYYSFIGILSLFILVYLWT